MKQVVRRNIILLLLVILSGAYSSVYSADQEAIRIRIGLKLFRAILAADYQINSKKGDDGKLSLAIIYHKNKAQADNYAQQLQNLGKGQKRGKIRGVDTAVYVIAADDLKQLSAREYAGLYIVEDINGETLQKLIEHGIRHQVVSYSPFSNAVEKGVSAGLIIGARVRPFVNLQTLDLSQLKIKPFFLKVSKHYEP